MPIASSNTAEAGRRLGKYQLVRRIAYGGMAEIFLARQQDIHGFQKSLVVKRILPQYAEDEEFVQMFLAEARLAAKLVHPNIAQVYDIGEEDGFCFFAMEYVHGRDLRALIRKMVKSKAGRLPLDHVINVAIHTLAGLHCAHEQKASNGKPLGIVHRDVSPSNVLVTFAGGVKLLDFGVAKAADSRNSTAVGILKGKIPYMSPEQCRGDRSLDRRSDIFSMGTVLWELSTFSRLFKCETELATITRIAHQPAPMPSTKVEDYPEDLERIVMKALALDRDERYATAEEMQLDLEEFAREHRLAVSPIKLGKFMRELFAEDLEEEARAEAESREATASRLELVAPSEEDEATAAYTPSGVDAASLVTERGVAAAAEAKGGTAVGNPKAAAQSGSQPLGEWNAPASLDLSRMENEIEDERELSTKPIAPVADEFELEDFEPKKNWLLVAGGIMGAFILVGVIIGIAVGRSDGKDEAEADGDQAVKVAGDVEQPPGEPDAAEEQPTEEPAVEEPEQAKADEVEPPTEADTPTEAVPGDQAGDDPGTEPEQPADEKPEPVAKKKKKPTTKKKKKVTKPSEGTTKKKKKTDGGFDKNGLSPPP